jgi:hypothetical protein
MNSTETTTYMTCILQKLWPKTDLNNVPDIWIAYTASTSEILLNPNIPTIQISEAKMKPRLKKYLKVVEKIINNLDEIFSSDMESSGSEKNYNKRNEEHRNEKQRDEEHEIEGGEENIGGGEEDKSDEDVFFLVNENEKAKSKKRKHGK